MCPSTAGVPTAMNVISVFATACARSVVGTQPLADMLLEELVEASFVDWRVRGVDHLYLAGIDVHADDRVPVGGKAGAGDQANVAGADNGHAHQAASATWLWWYQISER